MRSEADLHGFQRRSATVIYEQSGVQHVMPMGSGKTATAQTAIKWLRDDGHIRCALVIAPKRVSQLVWPAEPKEWEHLQNLVVLPVTGTPAERRKKILEQEADIYVVGRDNIKWLVDDILSKLPDDHKLFDLLIIDELSMFKNPSSKRLRKLKLKQRARFRSVHGLTGTPRPNGYEDQYAPIRFLSNNEVGWEGDFERWRTMRFYPEDYAATKWILRPEWEERLLADINRYTVTIPDDEMIKLPPIVDVFHWVDLPHDVMRLYKDMERKLVARLKNDRSIAAVSAAVASGKLTQITQGYLYGEGGNKDVEYVHSVKADMLVELTDDLNVPCAIVYDLVEDLRTLKELWPDLAYLGNGTSDKDAARYEKAWNSMQLDRLGLHPASAGHGLNLQHGGNQLFWLGLTWSAELYDQTLKRFNRQGTKERLFNHMILARGTVDEAKYERVKNKISAQEAFRNYLRRA